MYNINYKFIIYYIHVRFNAKLGNATFLNLKCSNYYASNLQPFSKFEK